MRVHRGAWKWLAAAMVLLTPWLLERAADSLVPPPLAALATLGESTRIEACDGTLLRVTATPRGERRWPVPLGEVSPHVVHALLVAEDRRFHEHDGVDVLALGRAAISNLTSGRVVSGASTLTMQLARILEPRPRRLRSKAIEAFRARQLERHLSKARILEEYLNAVPFGGILRGIEPAARFWYGKRARDLAPEEAASLVAMLPAPSRRAPDRNPQLHRRHRDRILERMADAGWLTELEWQRACGTPVRARRHGWPFAAPHACDMLLRTQHGPVIRSEIDLALQQRVEAAVQEDRSAVNGIAVVVLARPDGALRALVGSSSWHVSKLNAAARRRSAGSTLKPLLFALGLTAGVTGSNAILADAPAAWGDFAPGNFDEQFRGPIRAADALHHSRNLPAVRLLQQVGLTPFRDLLRAVGLRVPPAALGLDAALGTLEVSPLELARAWQRFADPTAALAGVPWSARHRALQVLAEGSPLPGLSARGAVAWKTGTSSGRRDAWCVAVTDHHVAVVWRGDLAGRPDPELVGLRSAAPLLAQVVGCLPTRP